MIGISGMMGMLRMSGHTFLEPQAQADLNDDRNIRNGGNVRKAGHNLGRD